MPERNPDAIQREIEQTRAALSDDVDALTDTANPKKIAQRQVDKAKDAVVGVKDRVMGTADDAADAARNKAYAVGDRASAVGDAVTNAPTTAKQKTRGNPLAAGLIIAGIWAIVAAILASVGKKELDRIRGLRQTTETLGKVPNALKGHEEDNR